ncbi:hypothetical protein DFS34DRAFT_628536 [Phlyctochytrium arcticum]|nr:hypothetical protein DFS34DRAFT_628536 [Phlyctochytrium arcticum]
MHLIRLSSVGVLALASSAVFAQSTTPIALPPTTLTAPPATGTASGPAATGTTLPAPAGSTCGVLNQWSYAENAAALKALIPATCTNFLGSLKITGGDIVDLNALANIQSIQLSLDLAVTSLKTLTGLANLRTVGENFFIHDNPQLANVFGLNTLTSVAGGLLIYQNPVLVSIAGLASLTSINADKSPKYQFGLSIYSNPRLAGLDGIENLKSVGMMVDLRNNTLLTTIDKIPAGPFAINAISIEGMPNLKSLAPLSAFNSGVNGTAVSISRLDSLTSLDGLKLATISNLTITHNGLLADVKALSTIKVAGPSVVVDDNSKLCDLSPINTAVGSLAGTQISDTCGKPQREGSSTTGGNGGPQLDIPGAGSLSAIPNALFSLAALIGAFWAF